MDADDPSNSSDDDDLLDSDIEEVAAVTTSRIRQKNVKQMSIPADIDSNTEERNTSNNSGGDNEEKDDERDDDDGKDVGKERKPLEEILPMNTKGAATATTGKSSRGKKQQYTILDMLMGKASMKTGNACARKDTKNLNYNAKKIDVDSAGGGKRKGKVHEKAQMNEEIVKACDESVTTGEGKRIRGETVVSNTRTDRRLRRKVPTANASAKELKRGERFSNRLDSAAIKISKCKDMLQEIMKSEVELLKRKFDVHDCRWFTDPVDPVEMEIPDYPEIIKEPICFLDIQKKLNEGCYENIDQFTSDMRLVFTNAITYNTDKNNPVYIAALQLSGLFEAQYRAISVSQKASAVGAGTYADMGSDDEQFIITSDEDSEDEGRRRKRKFSKRKTDVSNNDGTGRKLVHLRSESSSGRCVTSSDDSEESDENEDSDDDENDSNDVEYRIQHILCSKSLFPHEWHAICEHMNTREVTKGSVWEQPDDVLDKTPRKVEKFLIKWMHASYLHLSWENEDDLVDLVGATAKTAIKKYRLRVTGGGPDIFEDLARGEYFPSNYLRIERIVDVEDHEVHIQRVDYTKAQPKLSKCDESVAIAAQELSSTPIDGTMSPGPQDSPFSALAKRTSKNNANVGSPTDLLVGDCFSPVQGLVSPPTRNFVEKSDVKIDVSDEVAQKETSLDGFDLDIGVDDAILLSPRYRINEDVETITSEIPDIDVLGKDFVDETNEFGVEARADNLDYGSQKDRIETNAVRRSTRLVKAVQIFDPHQETRKIKKRTPSTTSKAASAAKVKKGETYDPLVLHGAECWITVKWEGLPYEDCSFENLTDVRNMGVEYETAMRAFYKREQRIPSQRGRQRKVKRSLDNDECNSNESPKFPTGELRDYQWEGVRWLLFNWSQRRNSILADEMGLGKTIQSAGFLQLLKRHQGVTGPFLIVAPLSTIVNWQRELNEWTDMDSVIYHGSVEDRQIIREHEFFYMSRNKKDGYKVEVVITTPETCLATDSRSSTGKVVRELAQIEWDLLIVDEAHKLKNHSSKFTSTIRDEFSYQSCLLLTGTPLQNNTEELWTLLNFIDKNKFNDKEKFAADYGELKTAVQLEKIHKLIKPYILRREKENVEKAVPSKEEVIVEVELTIPQKQYYRAIYEQNTQFLYKRGAKDGPRLSNLAMELRKCCNHPFLVKGAEIDIIHQAQQDETISNSETGYVDTIISSSGKMVLLDKLLPRLQSEGHRVLIFSQFRIMLDIIEDYLIMKKFSYDRIDGTVTGKKRQLAIDKYSELNSDVFVMLLSTRAGGVGINLTAADTVIIFDSDWNPQNDLQAQARAHRIGQTKSVKVYRLLTKKSYEMHMFHTASVKLGLAYAVAGGNNSHDVDDYNQKNKNFSSLSKKELEDLLKHGAYDIFNENKNGTGNDESRNFCDADIDDILKRSSVVIHDSKGSVAQTSSFSKASFIASGGEENNIDLEDPEFWSKVVGLGFVEEEELTGRRRKCRELVSEGTYKEPGMRFATYKSSSDSDSDKEDSRLKNKRIKKEKTYFVSADFTDTHQMTRLANALFTRGYGNWVSIRKDARLKWIQSDVAKGCRIIIFQQLITLFNLESFDGFNQGSSRLSFTGVADRLSLSPSMCSKESVDYRDDILGFMDKMRSCKVARLALASALHEPRAQSLDASLAITDLTTPHEDTIIHETINEARCGCTDHNLLPFVSFKETITAKEWNSSYFDKDTIDESFETFTDKATNIVMTIKSICPERSNKSNNEETLSSGGDTAPTNTKNARLRAEERLMQLEDMFDLQMAFVASSRAIENPDRVEIPEEVAIDVDNHESEVGKANIRTTSPLNCFQDAVKIDRSRVGDTNMYESQTLMEYLGKAFDMEESLEQPLLSIRSAYPWWTVQHDIALMEAVVKVGWPDNKKKFSAVGSATARVFFERADDEIPRGKSLIQNDESDEDDTVKAANRQDMNANEAVDADQIEESILREEGAKDEAIEVEEMIEKVFPTGFPFKDRMDLLRRLRLFTAVFRHGVRNSSCGTSFKKLTQNVLKAMAKLGRPRTLYKEMVDGQCSHGIKCTNSECKEAHLYRSEYLLLDWAELTKDCGVKVITTPWINRVQSVAERILGAQEEVSAIQKTKGTSITNPESVLMLADISIKHYVDSMERCEMMHRIRSTLAAFPDDFIVEMIRGNNKIPQTGPVGCFDKTATLRKGEKERERDTGMPLWWDWNHDVALLKIVAKNGLANYRKLLNEASSFTDVADMDITVVPAGFEMPTLENETPGTVYLTVKSIEKRIAVLGKNIQPVKWLKQEQLKGKHSDYPTLPPGSPDDKLQHTLVPIVKPRALFATSSNTNVAVSNFFTTAHKKQIGPSTKPGESIKGLAANVAPVVEKCLSVSPAIVSGNQGTIIDLVGNDVNGKIDTPRIIPTMDATETLSASDTAEYLKDRETVDAMEPVILSNSTMTFVPVENVESITAGVNAVIAEKKRKIMSAETKAAMITKRKATMAAKKAAAIASVDAKFTEMTVEQLEATIAELRVQMKDAATNEQFDIAASLKKDIAKHEEAISRMKEKARKDALINPTTVSSICTLDAMCVDSHKALGEKDEDASCATAAMKVNSINPSISEKKTPTDRTIKKTSHASVGSKGLAISNFFKKVETSMTSTPADISDDKMGSDNAFNVDQSPGPIIDADCA